MRSRLSKSQYESAEAVKKHKWSFSEIYLFILVNTKNAL